MDMSVKAGGDAVTVEQPKSRPATDRRNASDLDLWLEKAEAMGEFKRITAEVDPDLEAAAHHLSGRPGKKPGVAVREHQGPSRPQGALQHDRLQPVALLPDDRRGAGRSSAEGGAAPAEEDRAQDGAGRGAGRARDLQPEHRRRRRDRHPHVSGAAHVAARRRQVSRHRRRRHHQGSGDRPRQRRHLPHDDQGAARDRRLHLARQGRDARPREVVEDGQADADRRRLRHRSAAVPGRRHQPAEDRKRVRILFRHQGRADRAVHQRPDRPAAAGARRDHPRGHLYPDETFAEGPFGEFTGYYGRPSGATPYMRVERCATATTRR